MQHVTGVEYAAGVAAEAAEREGGTAAEIFRNIKSALHGEVGAQPGAVDGTQL